MRQQRSPEEIATIATIITALITRTGDPTVLDAAIEAMKSRKDPRGNPDESSEQPTQNKNGAIHQLSPELTQKWRIRIGRQIVIGYKCRYPWKVVCLGAQGMIQFAIADFNHLEGNNLGIHTAEVIADMSADFIADTFECLPKLLEIESREIGQPITTKEGITSATKILQWVMQDSAAQPSSIMVKDLLQS